MPRCSSAGQTMNQRSLFSHTSGYSDSSGSHKFESADGNKQDCDLGSTSDSQFLVCVHKNEFIINWIVFVVELEPLSGQINIVI